MHFRLCICITVKYVWKGLFCACCISTMNINEPGMKEDRERYM